MKRNAHDEALPWQREAYYVAARYRPLATTGVGLRYVEVEPGGRILPHASREAEWLFCMAGQGRMRVGEEETTLWPGDCVAVAAGALQGLVNDGAELLALLLVREAPAALLPELLRGLLQR